MDDMISRQAAIDKKVLLEDWTGKEYEAILVEDIKHLPSAQPPAIPISWLMKEIERLEKRDGFAKLDAVQLRVLIKRWESEQNDTE